ncbi:uncharacterized protein LOC116845301 [Odontomachus brunneus]|uniref:uncharacterized protein LOC116845301 n=1 Tax=Odontomachus brunneus TaxID=486640 RepID=UPI0013F1928B|nr:uncharacterized protein LOC116845301 [Odontomachus brunneus]
MHCLGAVTAGTSSPNGVGGRDGTLSVFRALGVLVCEGRIQGPPRGYKEGPHCAPPMQAVPNDHVCEENNYLCDRYLVLIREIAERIATGSFLCVEVLLCSDCPCGLAKSTSKYPVCPVPSLSISPWQHTSDMLLEYWCISIVPSKSPETMNYQGLYQAVRSRLHFSQVAAWWSRSNGAEPSYIATRIVPHNEDNLRKFRETPVEHTFPLAGNGDGNSIKITVWALPRMEEVPVLTCSLHPKKEKDEEDIARALTPTKSIPVTVAAQNPLEGLVLPALVDDRLQTSCNKSGKHHCHCEEEDASPLSPTIRSNSERKRRRSLPCGPAENFCVTLQPVPMPSLQESILQETKDNVRGTTEMANNRSAVRTLQNRSENRDEVRTRNNLNHLERCFKAQLNIDGRDSSLEKRSKRTMEMADVANSKTNVDRIEESYNNSTKSSINPGRGSNSSSETKAAGLKGALLENLGPFAPQLPSGLSWSFVSSWQNSNMNSKFQSFCGTKEARFNDSERSYKPLIAKESNVAIDPYAQPNPFHESNPGPSTYNNVYCRKMDNSACTVHQSCFKNVNKTASAEAVSTGQDALEVNKEDNSAKGRGRTGKEFSQLIWKLSNFPNEKDKQEEGGILDWFSKVPGRMLGVTAAKGYAENSKAKSSTKQPEHHQGTNEIKFKNCNLELSPREVNEVLAVLRARTPSGRRKATMKNIKRRERSEKSSEEGAAAEKLSPKCASLESANMATSRMKACDVYDSKRWYKKVEYPSGEPTATLDRVYYDKNVYQPAYSKFSDSNRRHEEPQGDAERLQNVSNKADVLLGAILRNGSRDRKGHLNVSNGTRPRSTTSIDDDDSDDSRASLEKLDQDHRTACADEKSLPLAVNKRFNKIRQLFKREDDRRTTVTESSVLLENEHLSGLPRCSSPALLRYNNEQPANLHNSTRSKTKRRIDFTNFPETAEKNGLATPGLSTKDAHQKPPIHSTNNFDDYECDSAGLNRQINCDRLLVDARELTEDELGDTSERDTAVPKNNLTTAITPQNGHSSSKVRNNNNNKDGVVEDDETVDRCVPSALEQERFRRSLENATSMVFHSRTGLPLTSSPAPLRRGSCCFDYDSSLNSVSSKRSALFELNTPPSPGAVSLEETDRETEIAGEGEETPRRRSSSRHRPQSHALLGSFEESALNGRLEPVSTVHGFTAELGASGSFCPKHQKLPVTVFFYTLGDNDKVSTPYLAHINLEKKGYQVPRSGTIQVTLLNPLGTVVKMFVVLYDLTDMPPRSHTFLRQRTLRDKTLRYLVHLRFMSSKSGRIYLHTDIRMIICRKSDVDTASDFGSEPPKELRSYIHGPTNPKFSPRC